MFVLGYGLGEVDVSLFLFVFEEFLVCLVGKVDIIIIFYIEGLGRKRD